MDNFQVIAFLVAAVAAGAPLLFGTLGEILTEKSGNLNLGVEGMMYMGGVAGLAGAYYYEQAAGAAASGMTAALIATVCAFLCAAFGALVYSVLTITLRANQNVTGLALTIFGTGFGNFVGELMNNQAGGFASVGTGTKAVFTGNTALTGLAKLFFSYNYLVYVGVALAVALMWFLGRSRTGLNLRSVGENPGTADAAGISVTAYQYAATCLGGGICGLGGMYIVMAQFNGVWQHNCISAGSPWPWSSSPPGARPGPWWAAWCSARCPSCGSMCPSAARLSAPSTIPCPISPRCWCSSPSASGRSGKASLPPIWAWPTSGRSAETTKEQEERKTAPPALLLTGN